jgi:hypothetical protein
LKGDCPLFPIPLSYSGDFTASYTPSRWRSRAPFALSFFDDESQGIAAMCSRKLIRIALATVAVALPFALQAQQVERDVKVLSEEIAGRLDGFSYKEGPESELEFRGRGKAAAGFELRPILDLRGVGGRG